MALDYLCAADWFEKGTSQMHCDFQWNVVGCDIASSPLAARMRHDYPRLPPITSDYHPPGPLITRRFHEAVGLLLHAAEISVHYHFHVPKASAIFYQSALLLPI